MRCQQLLSLPQQLRKLRVFKLSVSAQNKKISGESFCNIIVQSFKAAENNFANLKEICNDVVPKMIKKIEEPRVFKFIKAEDIQKALELQKTEGDFEIIYTSNGIKNTKLYGVITDNQQFESCQIQVLPSATNTLYKAYIETSTNL